MATHIDTPSAPELKNQEYYFMCGHVAEPGVLIPITAALIAAHPDAQIEITVCPTQDDGTRELYLHYHFHADTHAQAVERAEELAGELQSRTGIETECWGLHLANGDREMIASDY
jgi:hypothetical protein